MKASYEIQQIATQHIKFFVRRARPSSAYARLKKSIAEIGLKTPIGLRDITSRTAKERRRPDGGVYKYELVYGQGRLQAFRELEIDRIPAVVIDVGEEEIVGRFLAENMMRRKLTWKEKAKLVEYDTEVNGLSIDEVSERFCITPSHARKYLRVLKGASEKVLSRADENGIDMNTAEKLSTIPKDEQDLVIEIVDDQQLDKSAVMHLVDEASRLRKKGRVTKDDLARSLADLNEQLRRCRDRFKLKRLEYALGPQHLFRLAGERAFVARVEGAGIDISYFKNS
jgi:ParB family chromosome partitioning protein